jgi:hypothetical protein
VLTVLGGHEAEHVRILSGLIRRLGAIPVTEPQFDFGDAFSSAVASWKWPSSSRSWASRLTTAPPPASRTAGVLEAVGSIVQVEARHAAAVRLIRNESPTPEALDRPLARGEVTDRVDPFLAK